MAAEIVWRLGRFSRRLAPATLGRLVVAALVALAALLLCLCLGKVWLTPTQVLAALGEGSHGGLGFIVTQLRLPRALLAALVGSALAVSGLLLQGQVRNPLASPDLLGITSGASAGAVFYLAVLAGGLGPHGLPLAAMLGAGLAALLVYGLAWNHGASPLRLVLVGVGVSAMLAAATTFLLVFSPLTTTLSAYVWLTGSVYGASWPEVRALGLWWLVLLLPLAALARHAVLAPLDDDLARGPGRRRHRLGGPHRLRRAHRAPYRPPPAARGFRRSGADGGPGGGVAGDARRPPGSYPVPAPGSAGRHLCRRPGGPFFPLPADPAASLKESAWQPWPAAA